MLQLPTIKSVCLFNQYLSLGLNKLVFQQTATQHQTTPRSQQIIIITICLIEFCNSIVFRCTSFMYFIFRTKYGMFLSKTLFYFGKIILHGIADRTMSMILFYPIVQYRQYFTLNNFTAIPYRGKINFYARVRATLYKCIETLLVYNINHCK